MKASGRRCVPGTEGGKEGGRKANQYCQYQGYNMPSDQQLKHRDNYQTKHSQTQLTLTLTVAATAAEMAVSPSTLCSTTIDCQWSDGGTEVGNINRITRKNSARLSSIYIDKSVITINTCVPLWRCAHSLSACARFAPSF